MENNKEENTLHMDTIHNTNMSTFSSDVESLVKMGHVSYIDAIVTICKDKNIEEVVVPALLSPDLKSKLAEECEDLNLIEKHGRIKF